MDNRIFGVDLATLMARPEESLVPSVVKKAIRCLNRPQVLATDDLFEVDDTSLDVQELRAQIDHGEDVDFLSYNPRVISTLLKDFLASLPDPLLCYRLYDSWANIGSAILTGTVSHDEILKQLRHLAKQLPPHHLALAEILFLFFSRVMENTKQYQGTGKLAAVFGPLLLRPPRGASVVGEEDGDDGDYSKVVAVVHYLTAHYEDIFPRVREDIPVPPIINTRTRTVERKGTVSSAPHEADSGVPAPVAVTAAPRDGDTALAAAASTTASSSATPSSATAPSSAPREADSAIPPPPTAGADESGKLMHIVQTVDEALSGIVQRLQQLQQLVERAESVDDVIKVAKKIRHAKRILAEYDPPVVLELASGSAAVQGKRPTMEDAHVLIDDLAAQFPKHAATWPKENPPKRRAFYGVYDGHTGRKVADLVAQQLHMRLLEDPLYIQGHIEDALRSAFLSMDAAIVHDADEKRLTDGCTAVVATLVSRQLYIANVGDSEAVLARENAESGLLEAVLLTEKHKPTATKEKERIKQAGGFVVSGRVFGALAVSRSFGDVVFKKPKQQADCVSAEPHTLWVELDTKSKFLVLACDGLFDVMTYQEVIDTITIILPSEVPTAADATRICEALTQRALDKGTVDNVSVVLVFFNWQ